MASSWSISAPINVFCVQLQCILFNILMQEHILCVRIHPSLFYVGVCFMPLYGFNGYIRNNQRAISCNDSSDIL